MPIYSGGLGVLAGDHLKSASDMGVPIVGVGLFYTNGYFDQKVNLDGWQTDSDEVFDLAGTPIQPLSGPVGRGVGHGGGDVGPSGACAGVEDDGRPGAGVPARHEPRGE